MHGTRGTSPKIQKKTATWFYVQIQIQTYIAFGEARGGERQLIIGATFRKKGVAIAVWLVGWWKTQGLYQILEDSGVQGRRIATTEHGYIQIATH